MLSETGLPNIYYLPREDVEVPLDASPTTTVCPDEGAASYWSAGEHGDAAWSYEDALDHAVPVAGYLCFDPDEFDVALE